MSAPAGAVSLLRASGDSDAGLQRDVNEDRFHIDLARRIFMVIDGVGGQAAGGEAADTAVSVLRSRLERETGPVIERLREAITDSGSNRATTTAMANLAEAIQGLVHHMRTEQQMIRDWVDSQAQQHRDVRRLLEILVREDVNK